MDIKTAELALQTILKQIQQGSHAAAERALAVLPAPVRALPHWTFLRGLTHTKLGRVDAACELLLPLTRGAEPLAGDAVGALADAYYLDQRFAALRELLARESIWARSPRGRLFEARLMMRNDHEQALAVLLAVVDGKSDDVVHRLAGFDAVKLLDRAARYREAHALATRLHTRAPPFDPNVALGRLRLQQRLLAKGAAWCPPRAEPVTDVAFIVGMPRSGTTLLEQMLDAHPEVSGIGEHEGVAEMAVALAAAGAWPYRLAHLPAAAAATMQQQYRETARQRVADPARWTLDKSLLTWQWLPAVAAVLPGAVALRIVRDPRDVAISAFLSPLDVHSFNWVANLDTMRQVMEIERVLVPQALQTLGIPHETIVYEDLVADPAGRIAPTLARMGLTNDARVLAPERNARMTITLSHEQVRRPINDSSIGRWRNYDFAIDSSWDALGAAHAAARG